jgi:hypothetical protein
MKPSVLFLAAAVLVLPMAVLRAPATAQELVTTSSLDRWVTLSNVNVDRDGNVSGAIVNRSDLTIRQVKLMVSYAWIWSDDFKPGEDSPGRTVYITAPADIPPHGQGSFTYQPSPSLPSQAGGHFIPSVQIVGYTRIVPPGA